MNAMLGKAMQAAALPEAEQAEIAETVLALVDVLLSDRPRLTPGQHRGVDAARREALMGGFATDEEIAGIRQKHGA